MGNCFNRYGLGLVIIFTLIVNNAIIYCEINMRSISMKHIKTLNGATLQESACNGGCGECQTSCQSACKTSCTVANQECENK